MAHPFHEHRAHKVEKSRAHKIAGGRLGYARGGGIGSAHHVDAEEDDTFETDRQVASNPLHVRKRHLQTAHPSRKRGGHVEGKGVKHRLDRHHRRKGGGVHSEASEHKALKAIKELEHHERAEIAHEKRPHRAAGGRTGHGGKKHVTNVIVAPQGGGGAHPVPVPVPAGPPPGLAPAAAPPRPPMAGPPGGMPPGAPPMGMMPPRKKGGRVHGRRGYFDGGGIPFSATAAPQQMPLPARPIGPNPAWGGSAVPNANMTGMGNAGMPGAPYPVRGFKRGGHVGVRNQGPRGPVGESGPAFEAGKRAGTPVQHTDGKTDGPNIGRGKPITYARGGHVEGVSHAIPPLRRIADPVSREVEQVLPAPNNTSRAVKPASSKPPKMTAGSKSGEGRLQKIHRGHSGGAFP
jgi:hypothetical protein